MTLMTGGSRTFPVMDRHRRTEVPSDNIQVLRIMHHFLALLFLSVYSSLLCIGLLYSHSHDSCHRLFFLISSSPPIYHQGFFFFSFFWHNLHASNIIFFTLHCMVTL
jgi:hypothetical protein